MKFISQERLDEITEEVFSLSGGGDDVFDIISGRGDARALEARLQEVMLERTCLESIELAMYLRASNPFRDQLPTWDPLLNAAVEQARMRAEPVDDLFFGFNIPRRDIMLKSTDVVQRRQQRRS